MELPSPLVFAATFYLSPLTSALIPNFAPHLVSPLPPASKALGLGASGAAPASLLGALFLAHYLNRALISPLRTPSRSKSHVIVPLCAMAFNMCNGFLMGTYLSSPGARVFLAGAYGAPRFWAGVGLWAAGLAGNVLHDEVLFNIRRESNAAKERGASGEKGANGNGEGKGKGEHYAIPHGYLYALVSYPNYLCEWVEWAGFALAAAPLCSPYTSYAPALGGFGWGLGRLGEGLGVEGLWGLSPPWIFLLAEVLLMTPRALKGHAWYKGKFADYPRERRAVVPWVL